MAQFDKTKISFCKIERLKQNQLVVYNRLMTCGQTIKSAISVSRKAETEWSTTTLSDIVYSYSGHQQIIDLLCKVFLDLGQFSFLMKPGCSISEIQEFESKCAEILGADDYELPSDLRLSLMICDGIGMPSIFDDKHDIVVENYYYAGNPSVGAMAPLRFWKLVDDDTNDLFHETSNRMQRVYSGRGDEEFQSNWMNEKGKIIIAFLYHYLYRYSV